MKTWLQIMMVFCLLLIAGNLSIQTWNSVKDEGVQTTPEAKEEILQVVGKYYMPFDGLGAEVGFIVKDRNSYELIHYQPGSGFDVADAPKFLGRVRWADDSQTYYPLLPK